MKKVVLIYGLVLAIIAGIFYACNKEKQSFPANSTQIIISENSDGSQNAAKPVGDASDVAKLNRNRQAIKEKLVLIAKGLTLCNGKFRFHRNSGD